MLHTIFSSMPPPPCRNLNRQILSSYVYHNTPLFRGLINALDSGLNRYNPCRCPDCQQSCHKRSPSQHEDAPPSKRARRRSPSYTTNASSEDDTACEWCSNRSHTSRLSCRACGRRRTPPPMAQHFTVSRSPDAKRPADDVLSSRPANMLIPPSFVPNSHGSSEEEPYTPLSLEETDLSTTCDFPYSPQYSSPPEQVIPVLESLHHCGQPEKPTELPSHSPQSTTCEPVDFADYESVCTPEARSMASKSMARAEENHYIVNGHHCQHEEEINVASLIEEVSKEVDEETHGLRPVDTTRFSFGNSALSDVTTDSVAEFGGFHNARSKHMEVHKPLCDENAADLFLSEMIMSDEENDNACDEISDLPLAFLDGIFPFLNEQDVY